MQSTQKTQFRNRGSNTYAGRVKQLAVRQVMFVVNVTVPAAGQPAQLPGFHLLPGMEAIAKSGPANTGAVYVAKFNSPRRAANTPAGGAFTILNSKEDSVNLDGDNLSQWFVDADAAAILQVIVYMNRTEQFV